MPIDIGDIPTGTPPTTGEKLQIRTAIGLGQTDAPTFLSVNFDANTQLTGAGGFLSYKSYGGTALNMGSTALTLGASGANTASITLSNAAGVGAVITTDSVGILAQRNGTAAQAFRVYNTDPVGGAKEWGGFGWTGNQLQIATEAAGGGVSNRSMAITAGGQIQIRSGVGWPISFEAAGGARWSISATGHFLAATDNTYDIGAATANRPSNINAASSVRGEYFSMTSGLTGVLRSYLQSPSTGVVTLFNAAGNGFTCLEFGATNLGISRGTGSPEGIVTALVGSLYLRTDGGVLSTLYVKESGTGNTGWVAK